MLKKEQQDLATRNELVWSFHKKYPDRIAQFYWADPAADDFLEDLASRHADWGFQGIKLHQFHHRPPHRPGGLREPPAKR